MIVSEDHALAAVKACVAKTRNDVIQAWASEQHPLARERLWFELQAVERLEETISAEFIASIRRDAGQ